MQEKILERLLHCIWSEQLFRKTLQINGKTLQISSPGWWNLEAGPDFRNAELFIDGERLSGDIEIHLTSSDWYQHKHHEDVRYNHVAMHVVLHSNGAPCVKQNGDIVPELEVKDHLLEELRLLQQKIPIYEFPFGQGGGVRLCRRFLEEQDDESIARLLDSAGDLRMRRKKDQFLETMNSTNFLQAFYEGFMEGMGYKQSRYAFRELAKRVPIAELLEYDLAGRRGIDSMASILLGTAGLLPDLAQIRLHQTDPETVTYLDELFKFWAQHSAKFLTRRLVGFCWYPSSTRPANFPARRLTAIAAFFHYFREKIETLLLHPLQAYGSDPKGIRFILRNWLDLFSKPLHLYWSYHFQFERHKFIAPHRLIGKERGKILIVNLILPGLLALAEVQQEKQMEQILHSIYRCHPRLSDNSITRLMEHRLFGNKQRSRGFIHTAHRQQALHHFFYDFCDNSESSCSRCQFAEENHKVTKTQNRSV
ncbi:MAG: hypothetical protein C5B54_08635 [Acidobacteria bacterium]|nr:MAG: hypothetical protein C5B54_08635 [Acidobacteriota bacterium]